MQCAMQIVDSHCHLNFSDFAEDFGEVLQRAKAAGVTTMQTICTHMNEFPEVLAIAEQHPFIFCSVGVHPNRVAESPLVSLTALLEAAQHPKVIGIGETGLDYYYDTSPKDLQIESFRTHIAAARVTGLPLIVHTRDAEEDTIAILKEESAKGAFPFLIHCFTSTQRLAEESIKLGGYISLSGILTFKNAKDIQATAKQIPLENILIETDAPYLAPVPMRGKRNEPAFTRHVCEFLAGLRHISAEDCAQQTTANFFTLFHKAKAA
jgi:TatD DNase family protein